MALGIDTFIMSGYPHLEEAYRFAELVFPLVPHAHGVPQADSWRRAGPVGEIVANDRAPVETTEQLGRPHVAV
jgi:alkanesulfonate monooxygenase